MIMSKASSVSWEHTKLVRREGGRLDSTLKGMNSLEDGCNIETGFMEVPWKERARRSMDAPDEVTGGDCRPLDIVRLMIRHSSIEPWLGRFRRTLHGLGLAAKSGSPTSRWIYGDLTLESS
ncbi:hypothetical protein DY000_02020079 [Brassica cretica]|uniref:Uncharacterized protein n=1 Tax=Brassica cretica TaxID=69181 RepID=A0ABQ7E953_BRACR|nr:hypothetical protein DY000_02020079 [Brassica cretica]